MNEFAIEVDALSQAYGRREVLDRIELRAGPGEVIGLVGRNGCGKTTLLETLAGLHQPSSGQCRLLGQPSLDMPEDVRQQFGFVFQEEELFDWMVVSDHVDLVGSMYTNWDKTHVRQLLKRWRVPTGEQVSRLSRGQRQMLGIILALGHAPRVLLLDEPASALDPVARREFLGELVELALDERRTVVFSSHLLTDVERVATRIWLMREGRVLLDDSLDHLKEGMLQLRVHKGRQAAELPPSLNGELKRQQHDWGESVLLYQPSREEIEELQQDLGEQLITRNMGLDELAVELLSE